jgi:LAO/AO transport system kinase
MNIESLTFSLADLCREVAQGQRRSIARALSIVEDGGAAAAEVVRLLFPASGTAHVIGITGSPGVGKSTLVDALISRIREDNLSVAVLAIDPTSPFSGGALLGDRVRMQSHTLDKSVFIRSMANRGHTGGTAAATGDAIRVLEAAGFDLIIIETVGVGQSELAIAQTADTTVIVLMPGSGDDIQAIKSGIMEIGDVFVVNKGDLPGANKTYSEILAAMELTRTSSAWAPPVSLATAETEEGVEQVWENILSHRRFLERSGELAVRRTQKMQAELEELVGDLARSCLQDSFRRCARVQELLDSLARKTIDPHAAASEIFRAIFST